MAGILGGRSLADRAVNPLTYAGLGLLSQGPSLLPQSPFAGVGQGLLMYQQAAQAQAQRELEERRMQMEQEKFAASQAAAKAPKYMNTPMGLVEITPGAAPRLAMEAPTKPPPLKPVYDPQTGTTTYQPASEAVGAQVPPRAPLVSIGEMGKPLGTDAAKWRNAQGQAPSAELTAAQAVSAGFQPQTSAAQAAETVTAQIGAKEQAAAKRLTDAEADYDAAVEAVLEDPGNPELRDAMRLARGNLTSARAKAAQPETEMAEARARQLAAPGLGTQLLRRGVEAAGEFLGIGDDEAEQAPAPRPLAPAARAQAPPAPGLPPGFVIDQ